jgi:phosphopantetheine--protein transferase-like protein
VERLLLETTPEGLRRLFTEAELQDAGQGPGRAASLAARFAAKEACCKLFPREAALGVIEPADFGIRRDAYGSPCVELSREAQAVLDRHRLAGIRVSLSYTEASASAIAWSDPRTMEVPWFGKALYYLVPFRRKVVLGNLRLVFGDVLGEQEIRRLAQAYCAHFARFLVELVRFPLMTDLTKTPDFPDRERQDHFPTTARGLPHFTCKALEINGLFEKCGRPPAVVSGSQSGSLFWQEGRF